MDRHIIRTTPGALLYQGHAEWYVYAMFADNVCLLALKLVVNITILSTSICSNTRPILSTEHLVYGHVWIRPHYDPYTLSYYLPIFNYPTCVEREETKSDPYSPVYKTKYLRTRGQGLYDRTVTYVRVGREAVKTPWKSAKTIQVRAQLTA